ncbi:MAG: helix-turn-helix transcriptional regulator [Hungatella sp.]|nr:helix-turn-helix transcriptional regulator [Hungatella sp.]
MMLSRNKINIAMTRKKMSYTAMAEIYGVSRARMNVILNSKKVSPMTIGRLAEVLEVDVTEILEEE